MIHPPIIIYNLLLFLGIVCSFLIGFGMAGSGKGSWIHILIFAAVYTFVLYLITDIEYPRLGFIRVEDVDSLLIELKRSWVNAM